MILLKVIFEETNRNGTSVDDFYYRGLEEKLQGKKGTGVRALAAEFIQQGKILDRFLILDHTGCKLEIYTFFTNEETFSEFVNHPINQNAKMFWQDRNWQRTVTKTVVADFLNVRNKLGQLKSII